MPSPGVQNEEELAKASRQIGLTIDEAKQVAMIITKAERARVQRESPSIYFDNVGYSQDYRTSEKAVISYLTPKKNDAEVRVVGGTTEKKTEVVINELVNLNLQHEVECFDRDDIPAVALANAMTDVVTRTNQIERDEDMWVDVIRELCSQRAVFVEENYVNKTTRDKRSSGTIQYLSARAEKRLVSGLKVYLGDITIPHYLLNNQPYIVIVDRITYTEAETYWGTSPRWKHVKPGASNAELDAFYHYRIGDLEKHEVQVVVYKSYPDDEYQVLVNCIPMEKVGTKLPYEFPGYNLVMQTIKTVSSDFAYGRSFPSSAKVLQGLSDEMMRLNIRKFRQAIEPSMAIKGNRVISRDIWNPGSMVYGLSKTSFEKLNDHQGVTSSEIAMTEYIEKKVEEFIGQSSQSQGIAEGGQKTAQEVMELQKNALKMLGLAVYSAMRLKRELTFLRIYNILENYTKPVRKTYDPVREKVVDVYQQFSIKNANFGDGGSGTKIISFSDRSLEYDDVAQMREMEQSMEDRGNPTRFVNINIEVIRSVEKTWYVNVTSKPRENNALDRMMFREDLKDAMTVAQVAQRPLNGDQIIKEFEGKSGTQNWFGIQPVEQMLPEDGGQDQLGNEVMPDQPSLSQLINEQM